ncbi:helix-turn-helix transcriptional regulator [Sphingopyxis witflariensis]|uniref:Uncharacterized protein n=1 Tax=Sphingopyxis witflariensis TaxID=173675 RepID=A0A246K524_9SPHN|nr:AlpA family phage regulatory protein [Sphingopyxis witflariensis]OWR00965.1 hypothetical protein CDQ91_00605 [Sphingopyxis witflariensis]
MYSKAISPRKSKQAPASAGFGGESALVEELAKLISASPSALELIAEALDRNQPKKHESYSPCLRCGSNSKTDNVTPAPSEPDDPLVPLDVVKRIAGLGKTKIYDLIRQGKFPEPFKPGGTSSRWSLAEVKRWREELQPG